MAEPFIRRAIPQPTWIEEGRPASIAAIASTSPVLTSASRGPPAAPLRKGERAELVVVVAEGRRAGIGPPRLEEAGGDGQSEVEVAAGARHDDEVGERGRLVADRVDEGDPRSAALRLLQEGE